MPNQAVSGSAIQRWKIFSFSFLNNTSHCRWRIFGTKVLLRFVASPQNVINCFITHPIIGGKVFMLPPPQNRHWIALPYGDPLV